MQTLGTVNVRSSRSPRIAKQAAALYRIIHEYLQGRVSSETYPERKLIIKTINRPSVGRDVIDFTGSTVELVGDFIEVFNLGPVQSIGREFTWSEFCEKIPAQVRVNCTAGI